MLQSLSQLVDFEEVLLGILVVLPILVKVVEAIDVGLCAETLGFGKSHSFV